MVLHVKDGEVHLEEVGDGVGLGPGHHCSLWSLSWESGRAQGQEEGSLCCYSGGL